MDPMVQGQLKEWFFPLAVFGFLGWGVYLIAMFIRRMQQNAMQRHVLDKFSSAQDFAQFVQSPAGQKYLAGISEAVTSPRNAILTSIKTGFVLMFGGMGFLVGGAGGDSISFRIGWVLLLVGVGFLISAGVSYFLAKKVGWKEQE
jgi:hypothetical protein